LYGGVRLVLAQWWHESLLQEPHFFDALKEFGENWKCPEAASHSAAATDAVS
jgi:hypothetical protein